MALKILFWLSDKYYDKIQVIVNQAHLERNNKPVAEKQKSTEPFFKYFHISKNLIFAILLLTFLIATLSAIFPDRIPLRNIWHSLFGEFSLSNPLVVLLFFLALFSSEKFSIWLNKSIENFLMPQKNYFIDKEKTFIEKMHNYQHHNKFNLKF